ncbi:MAG: hypothetical protein VB853_14895 [Pirellulales bacterium]
MAWTADNKRFKHNRRVGNRVLTTYLPGPFAAEVAEQVAERRRQREKLKDTKAEDSLVDTPLELVQRALTCITTATLVCRGFHQHKGQWRKRHGSTP